MIFSIVFDTSLDRALGARWQCSPKDHRLRADNRGTQLSENYIRQNPVAAGLCEKAED